jgi:hypothetical protein
MSNASKKEYDKITLFNELLVEKVNDLESSCKSIRAFYQKGNTPIFSIHGYKIDVKELVDDSREEYYIIKITKNDDLFGYCSSHKDFVKYNDIVQHHRFSNMGLALIKIGIFINKQL